MLGANTRLEYLHIYSPRANRVKPTSLGFGFGLNYNRHRLYFNFQNAYAPTSSRTTAPNRRFSILYDFYILKKEKKTNLYVTAGLDLIYRAGPRGVGPAGAMYVSGQLGDNYYYFNASESFTADKKTHLAILLVLVPIFILKDTIFFLLLVNLCMQMEI